MTLSAIGDAETPAGGSVCIRWEDCQYLNLLESDDCGWQYVVVGPKSYPEGHLPLQMVYFVDIP